MNTYRIWFDDGTAVLENAPTEAEAKIKAASRIGPDYGEIISVELISHPTPA